MDTRPFAEPLSVLRLVVDERRSLAAVWEQISCARALSSQEETRRHMSRGGSLEDLLLRDGFSIRWLTPTSSPLVRTHGLYKQVSELLAAAQMRPLRPTLSHAFARSEWSVVHLVRVECPDLALEQNEPDARKSTHVAAPPRVARRIAPLGAA